MQLYLVTSEREDLTVSVPLVPCEPSVHAIFYRAAGRDLWCTTELDPYSCKERCITMKCKKQFFDGSWTVTSRWKCQRHSFNSNTDDGTQTKVCREALIFPPEYFCPVLHTQSHVLSEISEQGYIFWEIKVNGWHVKESMFAQEPHGNLSISTRKYLLWGHLRGSVG